MSWMLTATGQQFDLRFIDDASISLIDIAHHLSQINRYSGACSRPMSVAEHSLFVLAIVESALPTASPAVLLAAAPRRIAQSARRAQALRFGRGLGRRG